MIYKADLGISSTRSGRSWFVMLFLFIEELKIRTISTKLADHVGNIIQKSRSKVRKVSGLIRKL